jgi:hypothetical protein
MRTIPVRGGAVMLGSRSFADRSAASGVAAHHQREAAE